MEEQAIGPEREGLEHQVRFKLVWDAAGFQPPASSLSLLSGGSAWGHFKMHISCSTPLLVALR